MLNILTLTTLYPNSITPSHGIFVENRLRHLREAADIQNPVVAPVPWFPFRHPMFGSYAKQAQIPAHEVRYGVNVSHPRYLVIPRFGMTLTPGFLYEAFKKGAEAVMKSGFKPDVLDVHYFYPDGVAAARLSKELGIPMTVTARGTDINLIPQYEKPRQMIIEAANQAAHIITVCEALRQAIIDLGVDGSKITTMRNGVDLEGFHPVDREAARERFGVTGKVITSVGHLIERKGHNFVIEALTEHPDITLLIAGDGPEDAALKALASQLGVANRVHFLGRRPHDDLPYIYGASDAMVLASSREGWANVLLESMACGTPVVATDIWGTGEVVAKPEAGVLVKERSGHGIAGGLTRLFANMPDRAATRRYAEGFSWDDTTQAQLTLFRRLAGKSA
jgi:glycosyltransferase involved in cell wall biosynthesis